MQHSAGSRPILSNRLQSVTQPLLVFSAGKEGEEAGNGAGEGVKGEGGYEASY